MSYSLFIFNIFLKEWGGGGHKIKSGHKEVWEGVGWGSSLKLVHKKNIHKQSCSNEIIIPLRSSPFNFYLTKFNSSIFD